MSRKKIALIGSGNIGGMLAYILANRGYDIVLLDRTAMCARGKALDIAQSLSIDGIDAKLTGTDNYADIAGAAAVIVTAGSPRKPGMSRDELLNINREVIAGAARGVAKYAPDAFVVVVTNPLDAMVYAFQHYSGLPTHKVVGMAGILDSARFAYFLSDALGVSVANIDALVLGGHGDDMVPVRKATAVAGMSLDNIMKQGLISEEVLDKIIARTRQGGAEIVQLLQTGSAYYAPARAASEMVFAYLHDSKKVLPCAAYLNGQYGVHGLYVGVPTVIGAGGIENILQVDLTDAEREMFKKSVESVRKLVDAMNLDQ